MKNLALLALAGVVIAGCSDTVTRETSYQRTTTSSIDAPESDPFVLEDDDEITTKRTRTERTYEID